MEYFLLKMMQENPEWYRINLFISTNICIAFVVFFTIREIWKRKKSGTKKKFWFWNKNKKK